LKVGEDGVAVVGECAKGKKEAGDEGQRDQSSTISIPCLKEYHCLEQKEYVV
jgi:hypothetical protein